MREKYQRARMNSNQRNSIPMTHTWNLNTNKCLSLDLFRIKAVVSRKSQPIHCKALFKSTSNHYKSHQIKVRVRLRNPKIEAWRKCLTLMCSSRQRLWTLKNWKRRATIKWRMKTIQNGLMLT